MSEVCAHEFESYNTMCSNNNYNYHMIVIISDAYPGIAYDKARMLSDNEIVVKKMTIELGGISHR